MVRAAAVAPQPITSLPGVLVTAQAMLRMGACRSLSGPPLA
jgi:hypothetical protein